MWTHTEARSIRLTSSVREKRAQEKQVIVETSETAK